LESKTWQQAEQKQNQKPKKKPAADRPYEHSFTAEITKKNLSENTENRRWLRRCQVQSPLLWISLKLNKTRKRFAAAC